MAKFLAKLSAQHLEPWTFRDLQEIVETVAEETIAAATVADITVVARMAAVTVADIIAVDHKAAVMVDKADITAVHKVVAVKVAAVKAIMVPDLRAHSNNLHRKEAATNDITEKS